MFRQLRYKLLTWFLLIAVLPLLVMSLIGFSISRGALQESAHRQLEALRSARADQIEAYWMEERRDMGALSETVMALGLDDFSQYDAATTGQPSPPDLLTRLSEQYGYRDLLLISPEDGYVFYSVAHEPDYHTRLLTGPYRDSNLGRLVAQVLRTQEFGIADFERYAPSQDAPTAFMAQPLLDAQGQVVAILAAKESLDEINAMMQEHTGLGQTGETYLVGSDGLWRSESRFLEELGVNTTALNPQMHVDTVASRSALAGESGTQALDSYRGEGVLSSYGPLTLAEPEAANPEGIRWALIAEMDQREVNQPVLRLALSAGAVSVGAGLLVLVVTLWVSRNLSDPIVRLCEAATALAGGDLTRRVQASTGDEIEQLAQAFNRMADALAGRVDTLQRRMEESSAARLRTDEALREREAQYRDLFERVPVGLYRTTPEGSLVDANPAMVHLLGYPDQESLLEVNVASLYVDAQDRRQWQTAIEQSGVLRDFEIRVRRYDGAIVTLHNTARAVRDEGGQVICYEGSVEDITARRQAEAEIHALNLALEQRVADRTRELAALYEVSAVASRSQNLETLLAETLSITVAALYTLGGAIHVRDDLALPAVPVPDLAGSTGSAPTWRLVAHQGITADCLEQLDVLLAAGGVGDWLLEHHQVFRIPDVSTDARTAQVQCHGSPLSLLIGPMQAGGQVLGLLTVLCEPDRAFTQEEMALLGSLADHIGLVVEGDSLRQLSQQTRVLAERQRLARDLHDSVVQQLYGLVTLAEAGQAQLEVAASDDIQHTLVRIGETTRQALKEMRQYVHQLRPAVVADEGLVGALHQRLAAVEGRADVQARLLADPSIELPAPVEDALYHIALEALNNALRHARANSVTVTLGSQAQRIVLAIVDDGCGFDPETTGQAGMGLANMRERAEGVGGILTVTSRPGAGTRVEVVLG